MRVLARTSTPARRTTVIQTAIGAVLATMALVVPFASVATAEDFSSLQWASQTIHLARAWQVVPGRGAGITICDADTGVMTDHPDLASAIVGGVSTVSPATPDVYADDLGHGTWTAGIMVARGKRIWGVAPGASLLVAKVTNQGRGSAEDVVAGILWCVDQGAKVVNLSLDIPSRPWDGFAAAIAYGCSQGVDFAVAAGNNHAVAASLNPANVNSPCLIAVNASDQHDQLAGFSNIQENPRTVTAPGQDIISDWSHGSVTIASGTSASAPLVTGVLALLRSQGADARTAVKVVLASARHPHGMPFIRGHNPWLGYGILDAGAACRMYLERISGSIMSAAKPAPRPPGSPAGS
jgi:subtilisin family serine protease